MNTNVSNKAVSTNEAPRADVDRAIGQAVHVVIQEEIRRNPTGVQEAANAIGDFLMDRLGSLSLTALAASYAIALTHVPALDETKAVADVIRQTNKAPAR